MNKELVHRFHKFNSKSSIICVDSDTKEKDICLITRTITPKNNNEVSISANVKRSYQKFFKVKMYRDQQR